jgi:hypothetical protein
MKAHLALAVSAVAFAACGSPAAAPVPTANVPPRPAASPASAPPAVTSLPPAPVASTPSGAGASGPLVASPATVAAAAAAAMNGPAIPKYEAQGRRDPFESLAIRAGSDNSTIATAKLTGIIQSNGGPLALVETADGIGYILRPGDTLADGRLVEVGINSAMFSLAPKAGAATNRVVLKLAGD